MKRDFRVVFFILGIFTLNFLGCQTKPNKPEPKEKAVINLSTTSIGVKKEKDEVVPEEPVAWVNQHGYLSSGEKYLISNSNQNFKVINIESNEVAYQGELSLKSENDRSSGKTTYIGYFSDLTTDGEYKVILDDGTESYPFLIGEDIFNDVAKKTMLSFYFQRCGVPLLEEHAGEFHRDVCHTIDSTYHPEVGLEGIKDTTGGWHDAGDYGKYVLPAAITLGPMLIAYEMWPTQYNYDDNGIPESGNGISDFLDEVKFEMDWILKMQNSDESDPMYGAVHYMVNNQNYAWTTPEKDDSGRFLYGYSSVATAAYAAILAQAYRTFVKVPEYSDDAERYLEAAVLAWDFLERFPDLYPMEGYERPDDTLTGGYVSAPDMDDRDDRTWAAVELYISTGDEKYHNYALNHKLLRSPRQFNNYPEWKDVSAMIQWQYMVSDFEGLNSEIQESLKAGFIKRADKLVKESEKDGFKDTLTRYYWGSNGGLMLRAQYLLNAYEYTGNQEYYNVALAQFNYMLGLNPVNTSYITKFGEVYPKNIHHAALLNDDSDDIYPGVTPGGPNGNINSDNVLSTFFTRKTPDALCYIDHFDSWSSNENCILYNGPLVSVATYFSNIE